MDRIEREVVAIAEVQNDGKMKIEEDMKSLRQGKMIKMEIQSGRRRGWIRR